MPNVNFHLEQENPDFRADEITLKFTVTNVGTAPVKVLAVSPRIPKDVILNQTEDFSLLAAKAKHTKLCAELTELVMMGTSLGDENLKKRLVQVRRDTLNSAINEITSNVFRVFFKAMRGSLTETLEDAVRKTDALALRIEDSKDAERVSKEFIENSKEDHLRKTFGLKLAKLREIEGRLGGQDVVRTAAIADVEPSSSFSVSYVLKFRRRFFNTTRFSVSIEAAYTEDGKPERQSGAASSSIEISPKPQVMSVLAALFGAIGVVLKNAVAASLKSGAGFEPLTLCASPEMLSAPILAFIIFNVFELTDLFTGLRRRLDWRSAMVIGVVSGLASDRVFAAIKALIGAQ